jgi:hypothetical protein
MMATTPVFAATSNSYQPQTTLEYIAYLQGVVDALQAQIAAQTTDSKTVSSRVKTLPAELKYEVEFRSTFDIGNLSSVYAWFEYGEGSLTKATTKTRISKSAADDEYVRTVSNLRAGATYKYRAVYESSSGTKYYGAIRTFSTVSGVVGGVSSGDSSSGSTVSTSKGILGLDKTTYEVGDTISLDWTVPSSKSSTANWVGLFKTGDNNREAKRWQYLEDKTRGDLDFTAPEVGTFEFRLFYDNSYDDEVASRKFTITK